MKRLGSAHEEIIETLFQKNDIVAALKYLQQMDVVDCAAPRKFLAAALETEDQMVFYTVFTFFQQRNLKLRKNAKFVRGRAV